MPLQLPILQKKKKEKKISIEICNKMMAVMCKYLGEFLQDVFTCLCEIEWTNPLKAAYLVNIFSNGLYVIRLWKVMYGSRNHRIDKTQNIFFLRAGAPLHTAGPLLIFPPLVPQTSYVCHCQPRSLINGNFLRNVKSLLTTAFQTVRWWCRFHGSTASAMLNSSLACLRVGYEHVIVNVILNLGIIEGVQE